MIGRDWTHLGVAKLYSDIVANGYHIMYLTSRSVGQADTTRNYLNSVVQENYRLPKGPVILSPDRTIAALRREVYLRKPEVFKMACLRDICNLFGPNVNPFYAGFGNRLTDALSYRSVSIPSTRIFTINSNAEVSLDLLSLNNYKSSYVTMRELVDHFFPTVNLLAPRGGESFTDFNYWREDVIDFGELTASESSESEADEDDGRLRNLRSEDEDDGGDVMESSYLSQDSVDETTRTHRSTLAGLVTDSSVRERRPGESDAKALREDAGVDLEQALLDRQVKGKAGSSTSSAIETTTVSPSASAGDEGQMRDRHPRLGSR